MSTYRQLQKQIADLQKKADTARLAEAARVIASIRAQVSQYDLKPEDIFGEVSLPSVSPAPAVKGKKKLVKKPARLAPKYRDPISGKTWSGHGKAPAWIAAATKQGKRDDFLITAQKTASAAAAVKKPTVSSKKTPAVKKSSAPVKPAVKLVVAKAVKKPTTKATTKAPSSTVAQAKKTVSQPGAAAGSARKKPATPVKAPPKAEATPA